MIALTPSIAVPGGPAALSRIAGGGGEGAVPGFTGILSDLITLPNLPSERQALAVSGNDVPVVGDSSAPDVPIAPGEAAPADTLAPDPNLQQHPALAWLMPPAGRPAITAPVVLPARVTSVGDAQPQGLSERVAPVAADPRPTTTARLRASTAAILVPASAALGARGAELQTTPASPPEPITPTRARLKPGSDAAHAVAVADPPSRAPLTDAGYGMGQDKPLSEIATEPALAPSDDTIVAAATPVLPPIIFASTLHIGARPPRADGTIRPMSARSIPTAPEADPGPPYTRVPMPGEAQLAGAPLAVSNGPPQDAWIAQRIAATPSDAAAVPAQNVASPAAAPLAPLAQLPRETNVRPNAMPALMAQVAAMVPAIESTAPPRAVPRAAARDAAVPVALTAPLSHPSGILPVAAHATDTPAHDDRPLPARPLAFELATQGAPANAPTVPLAEPGEVAAPVKTGIDLTHAAGLHRMIDHIEALRDTADAASTRIRLVPDALGPVDIAVRRDGDAVHVHFTASETATRQLIADAQPRLSELAEARGIRIERATVDGGGTGGQPHGSFSNQGQPHTQGQAARHPATNPATLLRQRAGADAAPSTDERIA